jgi:hypothetical protein
MTLDLPRPNRRRALGLAAVVLAATGVLAGCAGLGVPSRLRFSETDLTLMLARQFPLQRTVLEVIDVQLSNPQLALLPASNRVSTSFDLTAEDRLFGGRASAHLRLDYGLRYEPSDHTLRLQDVRVRDLDLAHDAHPLRGQAQRLGALAAERLLENLSIYRMKPEDAERYDQLGIEPQGITVMPHGIDIAIGARARR